MLQTVFDTHPAIEAILARAALSGHSTVPATLYDSPEDAGRIGGVVIGDIDDAATEVRKLSACGWCGVKLL